MTDMNALVDQPTKRTARKVKSAAWVATITAPVAGIIAALVVARIPALEGQGANVEYLLSAMITGVATWLAGYYARERKENVVLA